MADPELMTEQAVAQLFNVPTAAVTRWGQAGLLRTVVMKNGARRYFRAEVELALARGTEPMRAQPASGEAVEILTDGSRPADDVEPEPAPPPVEPAPVELASDGDGDDALVLS